MPQKYNYRYENPFNLDNTDKAKDSVHSVPFYIPYFILLALSVLFGLIFLFHSIFIPAGLNTSEELADNGYYVDSFIAERARNDLKSLTDFGPKLTGSIENEYKVIEFLSRKINTIISESHPNQYIELDLQIVSGEFYLDTFGGPIKVYNKIQNVVVKLHGENNSSDDNGHSVLVNTHFDTVPSSPGGSDDGINVAIALEVLRKLSQSEKRQAQNVIFLFNGAEETGLRGAHGFIAHHKWANESKILINLEASGVGGKLLLFQTGLETPWLLKYYSQVSYPHANVMAEELFHSDFIPSDTDFRIFKTYGNLVGLDLAFYKDGYRYHTNYDDFSNIPIESLQHGGNTVLTLVKGISNAPEILETAPSQGKSIYFDVFGIFLIIYSNQTAIILNWLTVLFSFTVFIFAVITINPGISFLTIRYLLTISAAISFGWLVAASYVFSMAYLLDCLNKTMSWYTNSWFIIGLYVIPIICFSGCFVALTDHKFAYFQNLSLGLKCQLQIHLLRINWTFLLVLGTVYNVRSVYMVQIPVLINSLTFLIIICFRLQYTVRTWQVIFLSSLILPVGFVIYNFITMLYSFIPITGRMGVTENPEMLIALICFLFTILATSFLTVVTNLVRHSIIYYLSLLSILFIFFGLIFTSLSFPYSGNEDAPKPQRILVAHAERTFFDESFNITRDEAGYFIFNMDRNSPKILQSFIPELQNASSLENDCSSYTFCAVPLLLAKGIKLIKDATMWIPSEENPNFPENERVSLKMISKEQLSPTEIHYSVQLKGPDRIEIYFTPKRHIKVKNLSLVETTIKMVKPTFYSFENRSIYVISYQAGKLDDVDDNNLAFNFTMETRLNYKGPTVDLGISASYVHQSSKNSYNEEFLKFLNKFPKWTAPVTQLASYSSYIL